MGKVRFLGHIPLNSLDESAWLVFIFAPVIFHVALVLSFRGGYCGLWVTLI
jgi:hypothetical protein